LRKRGPCSGQSQAGQGNQDHGHRRRKQCSSGCHDRDSAPPQESKLVYETLAGSFLWNKTQDGRALRRYLRRWVVERLFAWLHWFRRLVVRYEFHAENFLGMVRLGCMKIVLRYL